jgi:hypothetical protein
MKHWLRRMMKMETPAPAEPEMSAADYLLEADIALKIARENYANACTQVARWNALHPPYALVDGKILRQFMPHNPEFLAMKANESRTHHGMCRAIERRAELLEQYAPKESRYIGGVKIA